jgi:hypothetical protein
VAVIRYNEQFNLREVIRNARRGNGGAEAERSSPNDAVIEAIGEDGDRAQDPAAGAGPSEVEQV